MQRPIQSTSRNGRFFPRISPSLEGNSVCPSLNLSFRLFVFVQLSYDKHSVNGKMRGRGRGLTNHPNMKGPSKKKSLTLHWGELNLFFSSSLLVCLSFAVYASVSRSSCCPNVSYLSLILFISQFACTSLCPSVCMCLCRLSMSVCEGIFLSKLTNVSMRKYSHRRRL